MKRMMFVILTVSVLATMTMGCSNTEATTATATAAETATSDEAVVEGEMVIGPNWDYINTTIFETGNFQDLYIYLEKLEGRYINPDSEEEYVDVRKDSCKIVLKNICVSILCGEEYHEEPTIEFRGSDGEIQRMAYDQQIYLERLDESATDIFLPIEDGKEIWVTVNNLGELFEGTTVYVLE